MRRGDLVCNPLQQKGYDTQPLTLDLTKPAPNQKSQLRRDWATAVAQYLFDLSEALFVIVLNRAQKKLFFVREVVVDRPLRHSSGFRDFFQARVPKAAFGKYRERRIENLPRAIIRSTLPSDGFVADSSGCGHEDRCARYEGRRLFDVRVYKACEREIEVRRNPAPWSCFSRENASH